MLIDVCFSWNNNLSKQAKFGTKHIKFVSVSVDTLADETTLASFWRLFVCVVHSDGFITISFSKLIFCHLRVLYSILFSSNWVFHSNLSNTKQCVWSSAVFLYYTFMFIPVAIFAFFSYLSFLHVLYTKQWRCEIHRAANMDPLHGVTNYFYYITFRNEECFKWDVQRIIGETFHYFFMMRFLLCKMLIKFYASLCKIGRTCLLTCLQFCVVPFRKREFFFLNSIVYLFS